MLNEKSSQFIFAGHIIPEQSHFNFALEFKPDNLEEIEQLKIKCVFSKISIQCFLKDINENINIDCLKHFVESVVRNIVDIKGFTVACGFDVYIESCHDLQSGNYYIFGVHENIFNDPQVNEATSKGVPHPEINYNDLTLLNLCGKDLGLRVALADFREAILNPDFTSFYCYRAIESLMNSFSEEHKFKDRNKKWDFFRQQLNIERIDINLIKDNADKLRHGQLIQQTWEIRKRDLFFTWNIIKKYLSYKIDTNTDHNFNTVNDAN